MFDRHGSKPARRVLVVLAWVAAVTAALLIVGRPPTVAKRIINVTQRHHTAISAVTGSSCGS